MPALADFTDNFNMAIALVSCITRNETTKAKIIYCCFRSLRGRQAREARSVVKSGLGGLLEYYSRAA
jgi:hypothetical protein